MFADTKEKHGMRYTQYRGLTQVTNWVKLKFAAMNLKKLATWKRDAEHPSEKRRKTDAYSPNLCCFNSLFSYFTKKAVLAF